MKNHQAGKTPVKKYLFLALVFIFILTSFSYSKTAYAYSATTAQLAQQIDDLEAQIGQIEAKMNAAKATSISTIDETTYAAQILALRKEQARLFALQSQAEEEFSWTKMWNKLMEQLKEAGGAAFKAALANFLNNLAYDTATYLATGDEGQGPMFETRPFSKVLTDAADNAAGTFLETLGKNGPIKFNLCTPNPAVMLKISLGLRTVKPKAPACTFSQLTKNWDAALKDKDFLPKFQDMFNPWSNDLGIALTLQTGIETESQKAANLALESAKKEFKPVTDQISGYIKSPSSIVGMQADAILKEQGVKEKTYTGTLADAIDIFINTLAGKLMDKWLKKGLVTNFVQTGGGLTNPNEQNPSEGLAGAQNRMRGLIEPSFKVRGDYDILAELTMCPDPNKAGPTNCVIDQKFREAIEKRLTVGQAMEQGYLNVNGVFGFTSDGLEPRFNEGYPYRSMLILRKFRILPMGWEVASQKIKDNQGSGANQVNGTKNLKDLLDCFSPDDNYGTKDVAPAWCAGLVDPNWVLKAEQNFCKKEGAGPEIISEEVTGEGAGSSLSILRNDTYCADEQSCIKEKSDGACQAYGYCTEERRKWDFNGKSCEPRDNTCQTFGSPGGQTISYLQNTLDYTGCSAGNAGCKKYATQGSYNAAGKTIVWDGSAKPIYLNKNAATCEAEDQGCHGLVRVSTDNNKTYDDIYAAGVDAAYAGATGSTGSLQASLIYEKLLPDYLVEKKSDGSRKDYDEGVCYDSQGRLKNTAPALCSDFVRQCKKEEAGCELYTSATDGSEIPAKVKPLDYCPAVCLGYDAFIQKATNFESGRDAYFIPKTAKTCSAEAAGCEQFTNLDEVAKGGEGIEYYTALRQCVKPDTAGSACGEFYNWEGSDESGYQLKVTSLKVSGAEPAVTLSDVALCTEAIYNLPPSDPAYNADCRQFYNRAGDIFYHLYNRTISCSDDCHPYRKTAATDEAAGSCAGGGTWNDAAGACVYLAIPGQGAVCSAAQTGCREYTGNTGNDVRNIFTDDFSDGTAGGWTGVNGATAAPSNEALTLDSNNKGSSLSVTGNPFSAKRPVGGAVTEGKSYVLNFVAKAAAPADLKISLVNASGAKADFATVSLAAGWQIFQTNLANLNHAATSSEYLLLAGGNNFHIDSLTLTEIVDRYYLVKNSWRTPAACDQELDGTPHSQFMLGCDKYADRANKISYIKNFSELCSESAVGCELMIDTHNSTATTTETFVNSGTTVTVPADSFIYAVYDKEKQCSAQAKGCAMLGQAYKYDGATLYGDAYVKNDPDKYKTILCGADAVDCQAFTYDKGEKYFKDPGDMVCEWRRQTGAGESYGWYKKKVKRCGSDAGAACLRDADCLPAGQAGSAGVKCQLEIADKSCPTSEDKTLGTGGVVPVSQPAGGWAGICAAANSGCGEYLDPVSNFNSNIIFNGSFQILAVNKWDGWGAGLTQNITLEPNTVYRLARAAAAGALTIDNCSSANSLYLIKENNNLAAPAGSITVSSAANANSKIFYHKGNAVSSCVITAGSSNGAVELKPVAVDYQLAQNLDSTGCNGMVNFGQGCVLFNERGREGANFAPLKWDADATVQGSSPANGSAADVDANAILKVTPDRTCDKWLACRSYIKDEKGNNICYDIGLCDAVDGNGNCSSFLTSKKANQTVESLGADKISNLSGYAKVGISGGTLLSDYYPFGAMKQTGEVANLANGGFEFYGANGYPVGWIWANPTAGKAWDANIFSVINNPIAAQTEGIGYAREGASFIKLGSSYDATSEPVDVMPNTDYIITAYVNTKNLKIGQAIIDIIGNTANKQNITQDLGNDWQFKVGSFKTAGVSSIKIKLYSNVVNSGKINSPGSAGNFYFDDVKIRPALNSKDSWFTTQSCRLYAKTDSLSCDYYEDSGNRQKGWPGYCLEYDRAPGNPNACLLWYPIDKVKGDGIEEGAGYQGKMPVYYTIGSVVEPYEPINGKFESTGCLTINTCDGSSCGELKGIGGCCIVPNKSTIYTLDEEAFLYNGGKIWFNGDERQGATDNEIFVGQTTNGPWTSIAIYKNMPKSAWVDISNLGLASIKYIKFTNYAEQSCHGGGAFDAPVVQTNVRYASKIAQTVTSVGQNKYWSSRVYKGSDHTIVCNNEISYASTTCSYLSDSSPFGSVVYPNPSNNPYEWDSDAATPENQPLYYKVPINGSDNSPRMGQSHTEETVKRLFAQSYGIWAWDSVDNRYKTTGQYWSPPKIKCGENRSMNGYCAFPPAVSNIKVNSSAADVSLTKNGFVNLTFNTEADPDQLPLVMFEVNWGDGESTKVTGVEMRDRPDPKPITDNNYGNPHSLYHLYSYWDLKAKDNSGSGDITCYGKCSDRFTGSGDAACCAIQPKVQIKDNWGWCNHGADNNLCPGLWDYFGGVLNAKMIIIKEK